MNERPIWSNAMNNNNPSLSDWFPPVIGKQSLAVGSLQRNTGFNSTRFSVATSGRMSMAPRPSNLSKLPISVTTGRTSFVRPPALPVKMTLAASHRAAIVAARCEALEAEKENSIGNRNSSIKKKATTTTESSVRQPTFSSSKMATTSQSGARSSIVPSLKSTTTTSGSNAHPPMIPSSKVPEKIKTATVSFFPPPVPSFNATVFQSPNKSAEQNGISTNPQNIRCLICSTIKSETELSIHFSEHINYYPHICLDCPFRSIELHRIQDHSSQTKHRVQIGVASNPYLDRLVELAIDDCKFASTRGSDGPTLVYNRRFSNSDASDTYTRNLDANSTTPSIKSSDDTITTSRLEHPTPSTKINDCNITTTIGVIPSSSAYSSFSSSILLPGRDLDFKIPGTPSMLQSTFRNESTIYEIPPYLQSKYIAATNTSRFGQNPNKPIAFARPDDWFVMPTSPVLATDQMSRKQSAVPSNNQVLTNDQPNKQTIDKNN